MVIFCILFFSSCVSDEEFAYLHDQINVLKSTTSSIQGSVNKKFNNVESNQASMVVEIQNLEKEIEDLTGRVDDNEHLIKHTVEKNLGAQDTLHADLSKIPDLIKKVDRLEKMVNYQHEYLNLGPVGKTNNTGTGAPGIENESNTTVPNGGKEISKDISLYESSLALFNNKKYDQALKGFKDFLEAFPKSDLADNAQFWIGECLMSLKQYDHAILAYQSVIKNYPNANKVPNAMLRQSVAWEKIGDKTSEMLILKKIVKKYPNSPEAKIAQKKLASIK